MSIRQPSNKLQSSTGDIKEGQKLIQIIHFKFRKLFKNCIIENGTAR